MNVYHYLTILNRGRFIIQTELEPSLGQIEPSLGFYWAGDFIKIKLLTSSSCYWVRVFFLISTKSFVFKWAICGRQCERKGKVAIISRQTRNYWKSYSLYKILSLVYSNQNVKSPVFIKTIIIVPLPPKTSVKISLRLFLIFNIKH